MPSAIMTSAAAQASAGTAMERSVNTGVCRTGTAAARTGTSCPTCQPFRVRMERISPPGSNTTALRTSMARTSAPNSAGSQFFIMHEDAPYLDGQYAAFGKLVEGFETLDAIANVKTDRNDRPMYDQQIESIVVED